jgi:hypothetical protein
MRNGVGNIGSAGPVISTVPGGELCHPASGISVLKASLDIVGTSP